MIYDYLILGGGASGLSLAHRMADHPWFADKRIAIIEKSKKDKNDRTWCYWEAGKGRYDNILRKEWPQLEFHSSTLSKKLDINPYTYKMIRGIDFYNHVYSILEAASNIDIVYADILEVDEKADAVTVKTTTGNIEGNHAFKSYPSAKADKENYLYVDQHFKGYFIETATDTFDPELATLMDFRIDQKGEARFLYVLPETERKALVEVAIFSNSILQQADYDLILTDYIRDILKIKDYKIAEEEFGIIPMTSYPYFKHNTDKITHIGTGGGIVKSSSGYAFSRVQRHSDQLIDCLVHSKPMSQSYKGLMGRFSLYDKTMLHAMLKGGVSGDTIFSDLFEKKKASQIFKFLDQDTSLLEELNIFTAPPWWPFTKAFFKEVM